MLRCEKCRELYDNNCSEWFEDDSFGGYVCPKCGYLNVVCEFGTDADFDRYGIQVENGEGYYDDDGFFHWYSHSEDL